ncbi:NAD(P)/FAD-dependent oxidoreductase [Halohasta salina]|uniref:NAD(P)/FAD-dependent oxidoreductase n=1 Tax=Halohasta salina TaxID=2961621 RepID=UPI0020A5D1CD|nr:FAD-dependent oxidoreductase [Halohasta salina]
MHVVVLGAGYAGVTLTRKLESSLPAAVDLTLVDEHERHLVQHEVHRAIRRPSIVDAIEVPLDSLFDRAEIVTARIEDVDPEANRVVLDSGETIDYDYAGLCLGADTADYGLPGVADYGLPLKSVDDAEAIRERALEAIDAGDEARFVVGGAGLSGVQVAGELATLAEEEGAADRIEIVVLEQLESVAPAFPAAFQDAVAEALAARGVEIRTETAVSEATDSTVETRHERTGTERSVDYDLFVWTGGIGGAAAMAGDRPIVRADLRLTESTFALGDAARVVDADGEAVPASASAAIRAAPVAASNITRLVGWELDDRTGFEPRMELFRFDVPGWIVSVGDGAVAQVGPKVVTGKPAKALKASVGAGYLTSVQAIRQATELVGEELNA